LDEALDDSGHIIGPKGGNNFFLDIRGKMDSRIMLLSHFDDSLWGVGLTPLSIKREGAERRTVIKRHSMLSPVNGRIVMTKSSISKDDIIVS